MKQSESGYASGQRIDCPYCGHRSTVQVKNILDGFTLVESYPVCGLCKHRLDAVQPESTLVMAKKALSSLFSENSEGAAMDTRESVRNILSDGERRFCKDCRHYLPHPFSNRCALTHRPVDPMDDCPRYEHFQFGDDTTKPTETAL